VEDFIQNDFLKEDLMTNGRLLGNLIYIHRLSNVRQLLFLEISLTKAFATPIKIRNPQILISVSPPKGNPAT
jgi:hypothetical protein